MIEPENRMDPRKRIIVALDVPTLEQADKLVFNLIPHVGLFKVGLELTTAVGVPRAVSTVVKHGGKVFLDLKLNDIPNTMAGAARAAVTLGVDMFNVHASAGFEAIKAVVAVAGRAKVLGVTVLTSISEDECVFIFGDTPGVKVAEFAHMLVKTGAHGIICSPKELDLLKGDAFRGLVKVIPGIRPVWAAAGDQKRITTPADAVRNGADYLVIGRPITSPPAEIGSPVDAARRIANEIAEVL